MLSAGVTGPQRRRGSRPPLRTTSSAASEIPTDGLVTALIEHKTAGERPDVSPRQFTRKGGKGPNALFRFNV